MLTRTLMACEAHPIGSAVPTLVLMLLLIMRLASRQEDSYAAKLLLVMRQRFGGHGLAKPGHGA